MEKALTAKQLKALNSLSSGSRVADAARAAGVSRETVYTWLKQDERFNGILQQTSTEAINVIMQRLIPLGEKAVSVMEEVLTDPATPAGTRVRDAVAILNRLVELYELTNLETRTTALENRYAELNDLVTHQAPTAPKVNIIRDKEIWE